MTIWLNKTVNYRFNFFMMACFLLKSFYEEFYEPSHKVSPFGKSEKLTMKMRTFEERARRTTRDSFVL